MKIAIISYSSRKEGCLAGVERFNWYLQKAIGGEIYTSTMFKISNPVGLNKHLLNNKLIDRNTLCIVDGSWGLGIPEEIPVISVVHGTWTEFNIRNNGNTEINKDQDKMWHRPNTKIVAVSQASAKYLEKHHKVKADKIILNGVDVNIFKPLNCIRSKPVIIHCTRDYNKDGRGKFDRIKEILKSKFDFKLLHTLDGAEHLEYQSSDIILQCSNYEGNSYFMLEGMACGLPVIATETGLFEDTDFGDIKIGEIVPWNCSSELLAIIIEKVFKNKKEYNPRQWIFENATFEKFAKQWGDLIREI